MNNLADLVLTLTVTQPKRRPRLSSSFLAKDNRKQSWFEEAYLVGLSPNCSNIGLWDCPMIASQVADL